MTKESLLLKDIANQYKLLNTYQDEGKAIIARGNDHSQSVQIIYFKSFFKSPGKIRFEWFDEGKEHQRNVLVYNGTHTSLTDAEGVNTRATDLNDAVDSLTGAVRKPISYVPPLLISSMLTGPNICSPTDLVGLGLEPFDEMDCTKLSIRIGPKEFTIFLSRETLQIHRIDESYELRPAGILKVGGIQRFLYPGFWKLRMSLPELAKKPPSEVKARTEYSKVGFNEGIPDTISFD